jgi:hypothetical protein
MSEKIQCELCKKYYKRINAFHLKLCHNITVEQYKLMFPKAPLTSEELKKEIADKSINHGRKICYENTTKMKGKTYEELYGMEKATELKKTRSNNSIEWHKQHPEAGEQTTQRNREVNWTPEMRKKVGDANRKPLVQIVCKVCGKVFEKKGYIKKTVCSQECVSILSSQRSKSKYQGINNPNYKGSIEVVCRWCGKTFSKKRNNPKTTCSDECCHMLRGWIRANNNPNNDPNCRKKMTENLKETYKNNPNLLEEMSKRQTEWLKNHPEFIEKMSQLAKSRYGGSGNPNWNGGTSFFPYPFVFNNDLKEYIRNKFGRICVGCEKIETDFDKRLDIHHIDYNKQNCSESNLVPVCRTCNGKANSNRSYWKEYYSNFVVAWEQVSLLFNCNLLLFTPIVN